jgi:hypothetical protein
LGRYGGDQSRQGEKDDFPTLTDDVHSVLLL